MPVLDSFSLSGQVAIVTGGGAGIGRAISELFAEAGATIVVSDLKKETADEVANGISARGGRAIGVACDVTKDDARKASDRRRWRPVRQDQHPRQQRRRRPPAVRHADGHVPVGLRAERVRGLRLQSCAPSAAGASRDRSAPVPPRSPASSPRSTASASRISPVEMPFRYSHGSAAALVLERPT